jgi:hypothetical protein
MAEFCTKHPDTEMVIRRGKRKQRFVVCPKCKPDPNPATPKTDPPAAPAAEKKNGKELAPAVVAWYDRIIIG